MITKQTSVRFIDFTATAYATVINDKSYPVVDIIQNHKRQLLTGDHARWYKGDDLPRDEDLEDNFKLWLQTVYAPSQEKISLSLKWWLEGEVDPYQAHTNTEYVNDVLALMERRMVETEEWYKNETGG